jgi:hypothetical protein
MLLLRALLLWALVSVHVAGGALLFRQLFKGESPWFGFIVPALAFCLGLNFIEHFVALPSLLGLLPFTTLGSLLLLARPDFDWRNWRGSLRDDGGKGRSAAWRDLRLPGGIFLGSFAFAFLIRCLEPSVLASSDGLSDLNLIANFCHGETLPPTDGWMPPFKLEYYYTFQHYAASVVIRLFGLDIGTGDNLAHALLMAFVCLAAGAVGWGISQRAWIAALMPALILAAATGSSAYLLLTEPDPSPWVMTNLVGGLDHPDHNPIWRLLATAPYRERLELQVPGLWTWRDEYHPNAGGHLFALCALWMLVDLLRKERRNWPWIGAALVPFFAIVTSTWALPITGLLGGVGLVLAWRGGRRPENALLVGGAIAATLIALWPTLMPLFSAPNSPPVMWNHPEWRTPLYEFLIQWWPVILLWLALLPAWFKLSPAVRVVLVVVPLMLLGIELINIEDGRYNTIEKMWGYTFGVGFVAFFSAVAARRGIGNRLVTGLVVSSSAIAMWGWLHNTFEHLNTKDVWHLEGNGILRLDPQRARLLQTLAPLHGATILTGEVIWDYNDSPALAVFSGNRAYIAWTWSEYHYGHGGENDFRADQVNDFYAGKMTDPLTFLDGHDIAAVVIWPDDNISDELVAKFKQQLAAHYAYVDCRGDGANNAGVFLRQPGLAEEPSRAAP